MNKETQPRAVELVEPKAPALLYEMIRSFVALADTLNLSHAVRLLGSTRQTVRRHISLLEELLDKQLFEVSDRKYEITAHGHTLLPEAREILSRSNNWLSGSVVNVNDLQLVSKRIGSHWYFYQQQHGLGDILDGPSPLLRDAFKAWAASGGYLEHDAMKHVRPYFIVYRRAESGWICVEFGEECFYVKWFGSTKARSSIGKPMGKMPGGEDFAALTEQPYREVKSSQGFRLDHIYTAVPREDGGEMIPVSYKRLMLAGRFPDGSFALIGVVEPTRDIRIHGLDVNQIPSFPPDVESGFLENFAKYEQT